MIRLTVLVLALLVVAASNLPAAGQSTEADRLIVPGEGIGRVRLGMHIQDVTALLGRHRSVQVLPDGSVIYRWYDPAGESKGLRVTATRTGEVFYVAARNDPAYVTREGLRVGSTEVEVRGVFGEPSRIVIESHINARTLRYTGRGIQFTISLDPTYLFYNTVNEIGGFRSQEVAR